MAITAKMVSELREMTGAAMMDCKKALEASGGDFEAAIDHLRKQGLKSAAKKAERTTAEGRVFAVVSPDARVAHIVGVACETDFLAGSDGFKDLVARLQEHVRAHDPDGIEDGERPLAGQDFGGESVSDAIRSAIGWFGENIRLENLARLENREGRVASYVHHDKKQGAIASVSTAASAEKAAGVLKSLCQHIVVHRPAYARRELVPAEAVAREKAVLAESEEVRTKLENVREKVLLGRLNKFYEAHVLAEQPWILDDKITVQKALEKELGGAVRIEAFARVKLGL